jgi:hypothetical protein
MTELNVVLLIEQAVAPVGHSARGVSNRSAQEEVSYRSRCRLPWKRMDNSVAVVKLVDQNGPL